MTVDEVLHEVLADIIGSWTGLIDLQTIIELLEALFETPLIGENVGQVISKSDNAQKNGYNFGKLIPFRYYYFIGDSKYVGCRFGR